MRGSEDLEKQFFYLFGWYQNITLIYLVMHWKGNALRLICLNI